MASLYEQLMAAKGAPQADEAPNFTQLRQAPMSLRSAMRKYAEGGNIEGQAFEGLNPSQGDNTGVDFAKAAQSGAPFDSLMQAVMAAAQQAQQTTTPFSDPIPYSPGKGGRGMPTPYPPPEDRGFYQPPVDSFPEPPRPRIPDLETPYRPPETRYLTPPMPQRGGGTSQQPQGPQTSYRMNDDGSLVEIGFDNKPVSGYTSEQMSEYNRQRGIGEPEYRYVWNGQGYDKVPNGPQIGYNPEPNMPLPPPERPPEEPRYEPRPDPEPSYEEIMPVLPPVYDDLTPVPPPEVYPQYPTDPGFYQPPMGYIPLPGPYPEYPSDPGILQPTEPVYNPFSKRGGDLAKLIADLIASKGGSGSLEEQRKLMALLSSLRG